MKKTFTILRLWNLNLFFSVEKKQSFMNKTECFWRRLFSITSKQTLLIHSSVIRHHSFILKLKNYNNVDKLRIILLSNQSDCFCPVFLESFYNIPGKFLRSITPPYLLKSLKFFIKFCSTLTVFISRSLWKLGSWNFLLGFSLSKIIAKCPNKWPSRCFKAYWYNLTEWVV